MSQPIPTLRNVLEGKVDDLGTDADTKRGYADVIVRTRAGETVIVRLTVIPAFRQRLLDRLANANHPRELLPAMLEKKFSNDDFLDSLTPEDLMKLGNRAMALLIGPNFLKEFLRRKLGLKQANPFFPS